MARRPSTFGTRRRRRSMFGKPSRRRSPRIVLAVLVMVAVAGLVVVALLVRSAVRTPKVRLTGTFTMAEPLQCRPDSSSSILHTQLVFVDPKGARLGTTTASVRASFTPVTVRGFTHCVEVGTYRISLPKADSYTVLIPRWQERMPVMTYAALKAARFRYDIHY